ncbi:MAG TPA: type IV secretion protein IcmD [Coxiellaceae bacterium]|nr:MAG: hypothetical protein A3E81_02805 [Gammaproteobacteria bacterium RIFCSPHIGHO2_12_FULL_36_30]HLB56245.1 type IV secretion protein IcmD [Coxiellaceae bacterium]
MFKFVNRFIQNGFLLRLIVIFAGFFIANDAMAAASVTLSGISTNVGKAVTNIAGLLEDVSLVCGIGFILASFFKFHQHKLQPTQVPMSQGVTLLVIGAGLCVFPHLLNTTTKAAFGATVSKIGSGMSAITGS